MSRLIDADALYKRIPAYVCVPCTFIEKDCKDCVVQRVMNIVDNFPTIDADDVVHGEWIVDDEFIDCSVCRREKWSRVPFESLVKRFRYCPNCGAKMDGEEKSNG